MVIVNKFDVRNNADELGSALQFEAWAGESGWEVNSVYLPNQPTVKIAVSPDEEPLNPTEAVAIAEEYLSNPDKYNQELEDKSLFNI